MTVPAIVTLVLTLLAACASAPPPAPVSEAPAEVVAAPTDRDGDGLLAPDDRCPDQAEDVDFFQDDDGCPEPDNDNDGLLDVDDRYPNDAENRHPGCTTTCGISIVERIYFKHRTLTMVASGDEVLAAVAQALLAHPEVRLVEVVGHVGLREPLPLATQRAELVMQRLVAAGVAPERLGLRSAGGDEPVVGPAQSRRVSFVVLDPSCP